MGGNTTRLRSATPRIVSGENSSLPVMAETSHHHRANAWRAG
jgi:hypothetical protein